MKANDFKTELHNRSIELNKILELCKTKLTNKSNKVLHMCKDKGVIRYRVKDLTTEKSSYLSAKKTDLLKTLQEEAYYQELQKVTEKQLLQFSKLEKMLREVKDPEQVFLNLPKLKTTLIHPYEIPYAKQIANFGKSDIKEKLQDNMPFHTKAKETVRSKSELIIADKLFDANIPYLYEEPVAIGLFLKFCPDFTVLNKRTGKIYYWEHFGMMDNPEYCVNAQLKLENLSDCGYFPGKNLIVTFESSSRPLSTRNIDHIIKEFLQ